MTTKTEPCAGDEGPNTASTKITTSLREDGYWCAFDETNNTDGGCMAYARTEAGARERVMLMRGMKIGWKLAYRHEARKRAAKTG